MDAWVGPAVTATIISSLIAVIGWFVAYGSARRIEQVRRREKMRDMQIALLAEIRGEAHQLSEWNLDADLAAVELEFAAAESAGSQYVPFVPRPAGSVVLPYLLAEVHLLPQATIDPVILYVRQLQLIERFVDDLRDERYALLAAARKLQMYRDYIALIRYWRRLADDAETALRQAIADTSTNSGVGGPSVRKSASDYGAASSRSSQEPPSTHT